MKKYSHADVKDIRLFLIDNPNMALAERMLEDVKRNINQAQTPEAKQIWGKLYDRLVRVTTIMIEMNDVLKKTNS